MVFSLLFELTTQPIEIAVKQATKMAIKAISVFAFAYGAALVISLHRG